MTRQCPSCGGICKRSGCERANVEVKPAASGKPVGYWQGKFSLDGGATLYEVPQVSAFGRSYPNIPLWEHPAPAVVRQLVEALQGMFNIAIDSQGVAGYHLNGEIAEWDDFEEIDKVKAALAAAKEAGL